MIDKHIKKPERIRLVFKYDGKEYLIEDSDFTFVFWDSEIDDWNWYWWTDGNGACDCNRSLEINRHFPEFEVIEECGDKIELIDYAII